MSKWSSPTKMRKRKRLNCDRKVAHPDYESAMRAIEEVRKAGKLVESEAVVYQCDLCGKFHWGRASL